MKTKIPFYEINGRKSEISKSRSQIHEEKIPFLPGAWAFTLGA